MTRDNLGLWLIDYKNAKSYCLNIDLEQINSNLFGHGSILEIEEDDSKNDFMYYIATVIHTDSGKAHLCKYGISEETDKAFKMLSNEIL